MKIKEFPLKNLLKIVLFTGFFVLFSSFAQAADITYIVDHNGDNSGQACLDGTPADCSLRSALALANSYPNSGTDQVTIQFDSSLTGQTLSPASPLVLTRGNTEIIGLGVDNFTIDFSSMSTGTSYCFYVHGVDKDNLISDINISGLKMVNAPTGAAIESTIMTLGYVDTVVVDSGEFGNSDTNVVYVDSFCSNVTIENSEIYGADYDTDSSVRANISGVWCYSWANNSYAFEATENADFRDCMPDNLQIINNNLHDSDDLDIDINGGFDVLIDNNIFNNEITPYGIQNAIISNNTNEVYDHFNVGGQIVYGAIIVPQKDIVVSGNTLTNTRVGPYSVSTIENLTISDNIITNGYVQASGIITGTFNITGNTITNASDSPIKVNTLGVDDLNIDDNVVSNSAYNAIDFSSTTINNTLIVDNNSISDIDANGIIISIDTSSITTTVSNNHFSSITDYPIYLTSTASGINFVDNIFENIHSTAGFTYLASLSPLSYNGIDYTSDLGYASGADAMFYQDSTSSNATIVLADDTIINSTSISDAQSTGGFMMALGNISSTSYFSVLFPNNALGITDLATCTTVLTAAIGATCDAIKFDYLDYDAGTGEFTWTGLTGFETTGSTASLTASYPNNPYLNQNIAYSNAMYYVASGSNTFSGDTFSNVGNGYYFINNSAENNTISDTEISVLGKPIIQMGTDASDTLYLHNDSFGGYSALDIQSGIVEADYDVQVIAYDQSGVPVPNATITAEDSLSNSTSFGTTDSQGKTSYLNLPGFIADSTGMTTNNNDYTFTLEHAEFQNREKTITIDEKDQQVIFGVPPAFGSITDAQISLENNNLSETTGSFTFSFSVGDAIDGIPIGGQIVITFPDEFVMDDIADLTANITTFTDDDLNIIDDINTDVLQDNVITITIKDQDIDKNSQVFLAFDNTVIDQNPSLGGDYAVQLTTKDELGSTLDTGYVLVQIEDGLEISALVEEALLMSINGTNLNLTVNPSVSDGEDYSQKTIITVATNAKDGYKIYGELVDGAVFNGSETINSCDTESAEDCFGYIAYNGETSKTITELKSDADPVASFSSSATALQLYNGTLNAIGLDNLTPEQKHTIYYAVNVDYLVSAGVYTGTVIYTVVPSF